MNINLHITQHRVWLDRSPSGVHVFVGDAPGLLHKMKKVSADDPNGSIILVRPAGAADDKSNVRAVAADEQALNKLGVAILDSAVERVDPQEGILLTRDERIIEFDSLTVMWANEGEKKAAVAATSVTTVSPSSSSSSSSSSKPECQRCQQTARMVMPTTPAPVPIATSMQTSIMAEPTPTLASSTTVVPCSAGCRSLVKRKSLHAGGEGLYQVVQSWRVSRNETWPW